VIRRSRVLSHPALGKARHSAFTVGRQNWPTGKPAGVGRLSSGAAGQGWVTDYVAWNTSRHGKGIDSPGAQRRMRRTADQWPLARGLMTLTIVLCRCASATIWAVPPMPPASVPSQMAKRLGAVSSAW
jgi:hypothetical protein